MKKKDKKDKIKAPKKVSPIWGILGIFALLYVVGNNSYLLNWLATRYFFFLWAVIPILWMFKLRSIAWTLTISSIGGIGIGQLAENLKNLLFLDENYRNSTYWGVPAWFFIVIISTVLAIIFYIRKHYPKQMPQEETEGEGT